MSGVFNSWVKLDTNSFLTNSFLSIDDIEDEDTVNYIMEYLNKYNVSKNLIFEIVETEEIKDYDVIINFVKKIKGSPCNCPILRYFR